MDYICGQGFKEVELKENGDITPCCPVWTNFYSFGNVFENSIEEIMNSEKAKNFRKSIINKTYEFCNTERCVGKHAITKEELEKICKEDGTAIKFPETFSFGHDRCCNLLCIFCRDHNWMNTEEEVKKLDNLIDSKFIPMLKDAKNVKMLASGELFASRHCRNLVKKITQKYPNIKFDIVSNGILFDEENCKELGIIDKLSRVTISVHAGTEKTYNKLIRHGNYKRLWKNINWLASLKNQNKIDNLELVFTITHLNFREMKIFAQKAKKLNLEFKFFEYRKEEGKFSKNYDKTAVWLPQNKHYKEFLNIISDPIFDDPNCHLSSNIINLRKNNPTKETIIDLIKKVIKIK